MIATWDLPNGPEEIRLLPPEDWESMRRIEAKYGPLCREIGSKHQLRDGELQAMIKRESDGYERARNREGTDDPANDGLGLLQITAAGLKRGLTDEQLFDPRTNIEVGAKHLSWIYSLPKVEGDFAKAAAIFNAGSIRDTAKNPYGMVSTGDHIDYEVRALNTWLYLKAEALRQAASVAVAHQFSTQELLDGKDNPPPTPRNT